MPGPIDLAKRIAASKEKHAAPGNHSKPPAPALPAPAPAQIIKRKIKPPKTVEEVLRDEPQALEAEMGVLGSMILEPDKAIPEAALLLRPECFHSPVHGKIFQALLDMWDGAAPVDILTVSQYIEDQKIAEQVGGRPYISQLFSFVPTAAAVTYYIEIVLHKYLLRRMIRHAFGMIGAARDKTEENPIDLLRSFAGSYERLLEESESIILDDAATMLNGNRPPLPPLVVHYLLHRGSKMILGASSKANKTWALMDLALAVSTGADWWGFNTNRGRVCYINLEIQAPFFWERLEKIAAGRAVKVDTDWLRVLNLRGHAQAIEDLRRRYSLLLRSKQFSLVIIDPVYKVLGNRRDENKAGDIATLLNEIERIAVQTGAAISFAGHFSKGNQSQKESIDRIGGSGVFARDPDTILTMTAHEDEKCYTVEATLRNLPPIRPIVVRWEYPAFVRDEDKDPGQLRGRAGAPQKWSEEDILGEFRVGGPGWQATKLQKHLQHENGMASVVFYRLWKALKKEGKIRIDEEGFWHRKDHSQNSFGSNESGANE